MSMDQSRRAFLKRSALVSAAAGAATPFAINLGAIGEAAAATASDYKALVCVFLFGGNDYGNTVIPYDQTNYDSYARLRGALAINRSGLTPTLLNPTTPLAGGRQYAVSPDLLPLLPVFDAGRMAVALNVGTLVEPTTKAQYNARSVRLPPKLFSHNDQQSFWQASNTEGASSGWGGRIGDLFQAGNGSATLTCINASGSAVFLTGRQAVQYAVSTTGPIQLSANNSLYGSANASAVLKTLMSGTRSNLFENEHARVSRRALDTAAQVTTALAGAPAFTSEFGSGNPLADQMRVVARLISVSQELGAKRQVFFVSLGGFDTHDNLLAQHTPLLQRVSGAMRAFYDATVTLGVADKVTAFTASDFGRTLTVNASGSDHGWGSMHMVMGGAVNGRALYGTPPVVADNGPDDVGQGRLLPTMSVDQYAATMARWFGVSTSDMASVLPNIVNYNPSSWNVGFV